MDDGFHYVSIAGIARPCARLSSLPSSASASTLPFGAIVFPLQRNYHPTLTAVVDKHRYPAMNLMMIRRHHKNTQETSPVDTVVNIDNAIAAHSRWKMKFRTAISKREPIDPSTIHKDGCEMGSWLSGPGRDRYGAHPEFQLLLQRHDAFHVEAAKVVAALKAGKFGEASKMITPGSPFSRSSSAVNIALSFLKQRVGG